MKSRLHFCGKNLFVLTIFGLFLLFSSVTVYAALGDVNYDSNIDIVDALLIAQYYVGLNPSNFDYSSADVNATGSVDIVDALLIAQYYVGLINQFPGQTTTPAPTQAPTNPPSSGCVTDPIFAGEYWMMNNIWGEGGGSQCIFFDNINSWGSDANHTSGDNIKSYPAVILGCHWATCGSNTGLPLQVNQINTLTTHWTQSASGNAWDAAYDIWFHPSSDPGNNPAQYEMMLWLNWTDGFNPIAENYDQNGAIPYASNVNLGGNTWHVYHRDDVFTFRLVNRSNSINVDVRPIIDYVIARGWMVSSAYCTSVQAGWEIIQGGTFRTSSFGVTLN